MSDLGFPPAPQHRPAPRFEPESRVPIWAIILVVVLILTGGGFLARTLLDSSKHHGPTYPAAWDARILPYTKIAEKQRGLYFKHPVAVKFLPAAKFEKTVTSDEKDLSKNDRKEIDQAMALLRAFGLVKGNPDLFDAVNDFSGSGTLAYYSFDDQNITVRGQRVTPAMKSTLVHELTHVLQDQNFGIGAKMKKLEKSKDDSTDEGSVLDAVIEGDADRVETSYRQSLPPKQRKALDSSKQGEFDEANKTYKKIPKIIVTMMSSSYTLGEALVQTAAADGGNSSVDALFRKIPKESALIDPLKALAGKTRATDVGVPKLAGGEKKLDSGAFGALQWYFMLAERIPLHQALAAADGRGGDSYISFTRDGNVCARATYTGETGGDTSRMLSALQRWVAAAPGSPAKVSRTGDRLGFESCDPGTKAKVGKDVSDQAVNLLLTRAYIGAGFVKRGISPSKADCLAHVLTSTYSVAQLNDPTFGTHSAQERARMLQLGASCRSA
ncbi:hypothetical protein [Marmoricola sp. URHB0036]|uniref:hypothetical protein n=1 Tax=Marmoricola sp. URHB0036 TaxID=1298863 RepID=UPI00041DE944|nr:hypothetical protein [Marmoricola sp. URHB0036]